MLKNDQIYFGICRNEYMKKDQFEKYMSLVPVDIQERVKAKVNQLDKQTILLGRLLLLKYANMLISDFEWSMVKYLEYGKPYLSSREFAFSISHSGHFVVCAIQKNGTIGIDIERINDIDFSDFKNIFHKTELIHLNTCLNPTHDFYRMWTRKEAFTKALGVGISYPLHKINSLENYFQENGKTIAIQEVEIHLEYLFSYATDIIKPELIIQNYQF